MHPWIVLTPSPPGQHDGIGDYAGHLADALTQAGSPATLVVRPDTGARHTWRTLSEAVLVQYYPQAYAHADFLVLLSALSRLRRSGHPVIVTAHELWAHQDGRWRRALLHHAHRRMLAALLQRADRVVVTNQHAADTLAGAGLVAADRVCVIPVGPNIPQTSASHLADVPTLVMFGQPAALHRGALQALGQWIEASAGGVRLLWLGRNPEQLRAAWRDLGHTDTWVTFAGGLPADVMSAHIASAWIAVAPYVDGASTRRSSLSSLIGHGLPVVGLDGPITDATVRASGACVLRGLEDASAWTTDIAAVLADQTTRDQMAAAARRLVSERLSWSVIAQQYLACATCTPGSCDCSSRPSPQGV